MMAKYFLRSFGKNSQNLRIITFVKLSTGKSESEKDTHPKTQKHVVGVRLANLSHNYEIIISLEFNRQFHF